MNQHFSKLVTLALAITVSIWLVGCSSDDDTPTNPGDGGGSHYPLAMGYQWIYDAQDFSNNILVSVHVDTFKIYTIRNHLFKTWYGTMILGDEFFFRSDTGGVYSILELWGDYSNEIPVYVPAATVGQQWKVEVFVDSVTVEVLAVNESVATPSGTYTGCHRYHWSFGGITLTKEITFKSGVGMVKVVTTDSLDYVEGIESRREMLLKSYRIH